MRLHPFIGGFIAIVLLASGACSVKNDGEASGVVQLQALSMGVGAESSTKADAGVITEMLSTEENPSFRGLSRIRVVPFFTGLGIKVRPGDKANGFARQLPDIQDSATDEVVYDGNHFHSGLLAESHAHFFSGGNATFSSGTTAALVYARATEPEVPEEPMALRAHKQLYGSLTETVWKGEDDSHPATGDIGFAPDPIYGSDIAAAAGEMADLLNNVASASKDIHYYYHINDRDEEGDAVVVWADAALDCSVLRNAFLAFVADKGDGPGLFAASGVNLLWRISALESTLQGFVSEDSTPVMHEHEGQSYTAYVSGVPLTKGDLYNALCAELKTRAQACKTAMEAYRDFPLAFGLPFGAAYMQWDEGHFQALPEALDGWVPATRFSYMPALYYYVNTTVSTSYNRDIYEEYTGKSWPDIVALHTAGKMVTRDTRVVVLDDPLQFACGMLMASVQATVNPLDDLGSANSFDLDETSTDFPLRGIIIGGQYPQHYDFTPVTDDAGSVILNEQFMYDAHFSDIYVNTLQSALFRTLVLPTPLQKDVYIYLELENNSGRDFQGADGIIPDGSRFYLAGKIPAPSETDMENGVNRVFMQDHYSLLTCKVTSLENAYLCIPQMGKPELILGVDIKVNWFFSPSSYVMLG